MAKKKIPRAGLIPYVIEGNDILILLMRPSDSKYGGDDFQIAKGKIEEGEEPEEAAIREASEELGLKPKNLKFTEYLDTFLGYTDVYYGEVYDKEDFTDFTYETAETKWMTIDEFLECGRRIHRPIVKAFKRRVSY